MSGEGPESIPTSADPKSHRPTKKRALTPSTAQAASVDALFARPDQNIRVPPSGDLKSTRAPPPEIVTNVQGSSAGAGSGEFHVYKASRRREYERLKEMDDEVKKEKDQVDFEKSKEARDKRDEEKTRRNREKREKMKARKKNKGATGGGAKPSAGSANGKTADALNSEEDRNKDGGKEGENGRDKGDTESAAVSSAAAPGLVIHDDDD